MDSMIGKSIPRKEDFRLLTGRGRFSDDVNIHGQAYAAFVRSPHAHARITGIEAAAALATSGVLAVLTGADATADGLSGISHNPLHSSPPDIAIPNRDGSDHFVAPHYVLPDDKARFVGEPVAMVIAETIEAARDGAELVEVGYEPLPAVADVKSSLDATATRVWETRPNNLCIDGDVGEPDAVAAAIGAAHHVVRLETHPARVTGVPMEPRAAVGEFNRQTGRYTVHAGGGGVVRPKREIAEILGVAFDDVRVTAYDVGGNYGTRNALYPEFALVAWAARRTGRPVKWTASRSEALATDYQAREIAVEAELALDAEGHILALRTSNASNIGAHAVSFLPLVKGIEIMPVTYRVPAAAARARAVTSNTAPTYPYRSAGRPEIIYVMERMIDIAATDLGLDRVEIRRRNMVPPSAIPYDNRLGMVYDSGDFPLSMEQAVEISDWAGFEARREDARARGRLRGIGIANYIDLSTGAPRERAEITIDSREQHIDVVIGTLAAGQGHETSFGQVVADLLEAPYETVRLITGDTDIVKVGGGTHSGRSMRMGAIVLSNAAGEIIERGKAIASHMLEAAAADIEYGAGLFTVAGTDRSVGLFEVATAAQEQVDLPEELHGPLEGQSEIYEPTPAFGNGCHVCEVEIDPDTGVVDIVRYTAVDDVGRAINPLLIDGQTHGGIAQGAGQALMEKIHYDLETGQLLSGTFMDYAMPRARDFPSFTTAITEVPAPTNPLGIKPGSEGGTAPAPAVITNAIVDALRDYGVRHIEIPATPERVWRAMRTAGNIVST
jgi:carbon-monoxide dehydrogenase large subunit